MYPVFMEQWELQHQAINLVVGVRLFPEQMFLEIFGSLGGLDQPAQRAI